MTEYEAYQEHIRDTHDTYCRIVIRHASFDAARMLAARWKQEISLEYLTEEKFVPLSTTDEYFQVPDYGEIYPFSVRGQTIFLDSCSLAAALAGLPEQTQEEIFLYYFQHLTQKEIGEQNGWTRSTIGRHIQLVLVFPPRDENDKFAILPYFWIPEDTLEFRVRRDHVPYDVWEKQGYLMTTEGNVVHYGFIEKFIERLGERFNIREIAFDRWGAVQMVQNLEGMGFTVVPFGQGFKDMSPPTKELMKLTLEKRLAHGGHPVLRWMMDNIFIRTDPAGNIKADKEKSTEKIDGAIATIMGLDRAIRCGNPNTESVYDSRDILFI